MADPTGEAGSAALRLDFDRRLMLQFRGSAITSDAGLMPSRELDDASGLTDTGAEVLADTRTGKDGRHRPAGLLLRGVAISFARIAAIVAAASVLWGSSASAAGPRRGFQVGLWSGGAYTDDRTGDFTHCSAGVTYDSGINMFILVTSSYRWWLGFVDPQWTFAPNAKMAVELLLDGGPRLAMVGTVPSPLVLSVPLPSDPHLIDRLGRSSELNLIAEGRPFFFKLSGTPAVTDELKNCVQRSLALETHIPATIASAELATGSTSILSPNTRPAPAETPSPPAAAPLPVVPAVLPTHSMSATPPTSAAVASESAPLSAVAPSITDVAALDMPRPSAAAVTPAFSPPPQTTGAMPPATATDLEEFRLAQDFFTTAQLPNARLVVTDKPVALAGFTAVWRSDNAAGAVKIIPPAHDVSGIGIASDLIAVDPRMCKGDFASARSTTNVDSNVVFSVILSCNVSNEQRTAEYFITGRRKGGFVVFAVVGSSLVDAGARPDQQRIDLLTRAAVRAAGGE